MKTILIPTDFSENAKNAMNYALDLATRERAKTILLHVIPSKISLKKKNIAEEFEAEEHLQEIQREIIEDKKINCERLLLYGNPAKKILQIIGEKHPDLIAMGMRGSGFKKRIGGITLKVLEKAKCPVLVIPEKATFKEIKKIIFASDEHSSDIDVLKNLSEISGLLNAQIAVLHFSANENSTEENEVFEKFKAKIISKIPEANFSFELIAGKNIAEDLEKFSQINNASLLAVSAHQRNIIDKIFGKSITKKLAFHTSVPLLVFHYKQQKIHFLFGLAIEK